MMDDEYKYLLSLLNDENEQSASLAMAALLSRGDKERSLEEFLRKLQETPDTRLRKRVHQMQSTIALRRRRKILSRKLSATSPDLLDGLIQIHLLWFDNDSAPALKKQWNKLVADAGKRPNGTLEDIAYFMRSKEFRATHIDDFEPESFCLGSVLDDKIGSDFILAAMACLLYYTLEHELKVFVTQTAEKDFILVDSSGGVLLPANNWEYIRPTGEEMRFEVWSVQELLKYTANMLFTAAAAMDSFRYVYTIGSCLAGNAGAFDVLPYPCGNFRRGKKRQA